VHGSRPDVSELLKAEPFIPLELADRRSRPKAVIAVRAHRAEVVTLAGAAWDWQVEERLLDSHHRIRVGIALPKPVPILEARLELGAVLEEGRLQTGCRFHFRGLTLKNRTRIPIRPPLLHDVSELMCQ
jgi:hypothetical protein